MWSWDLYAIPHIESLQKDLKQVHNEIDRSKNLIDALKIQIDNLKTFQGQSQEARQNSQKAITDIIAQLYVLLQTPPLLVMTSENGSLEHLLALNVLKANFDQIQKEKLPLEISISQVTEGLHTVEKELMELDGKIKELEERKESLETTIKTEIEVSKAVDQRIFLSLEKGVLKRPVTGKITKSDDKLYSRGLRLEADSGEVVKCPIDGKVAFAGQFRTFGNLIIIEISKRVHVVLAGLGEITATVDKEVRAGERLGTMMKQSPPPLLYLEIRQDGQPMHPQLSFID